MPDDYTQIDPERFDFGSMKELSQTTPAKLVDRILAGLVQIPKVLDDLPLTETLAREMSRDLAVQFGFATGTASVKAVQHYFIERYLQYKEISEGDEKVVVGVGIEWVAEITQINAGAKISTMATVAASAELGMLKASVRFKVIGVSSAAIRNATPNPSDLKLAKYVELANAVTEIKKLMSLPDTKVSPQILAWPTA